MTDSNSQTPLAEQDYDAIQAAVMETSRGRWFLAEYARRNRNSDTTVLLDAIKKLERAIEQPAASLEHEQVRFDLMEMASEIAQTRMDIAAIAPKGGEENHLSSVATELDSVVEATEAATYKILTGAENVQEAVWKMRDRGADEEDCQLLEQCATDIFSACDFQDLTGQRIAKVVNVVGYIEERLNSMIEIWGDESLIAMTQAPDDLELRNSYLQSHVAITQDTVDDLMFDGQGCPATHIAGELPAPLPVAPLDEMEIDTSGAHRLPDDDELMIDGEPVAEDADEADVTEAAEVDAPLEFDPEGPEGEIAEAQEENFEWGATGGDAEESVFADDAIATDLDNGVEDSPEAQDDMDLADIDNLSQNEKIALFT